MRVTDRDSMLTARQATAAEGILMGESCGTALWAALQVARDLDDPDALFVVILPDGGRNYVGKLFNDDWLRRAGAAGRGRVSRRLRLAHDAHLGDPASRRGVASSLTLMSRMPDLHVERGQPQRAGRRVKAAWQRVSRTIRSG